MSATPIAAVVTGAAKGIGYATATLLAREAVVVAVDIDERALDAAVASLPPGRVVALVPGAGKPLAGRFEGTVTLLLGGERAGLPAEVLVECDEVRHIPQPAGDSLNVAMAATVALYEVTRMAPR